MSESIVLRAARKDDAPTVLQLIKELAAYENLSGDVIATEEEIVPTLFGPMPHAEVVLGFWEGEPVGLAVYFFQYSTFKAAPVLYVEDLFVKPEARGRGVGKALF